MEIKSFNCTQQQKKQARYVELSQEEQGLQLIQFLQKRYPQLPRGLLEKSFRKGWTRLEGRRVKSDSVLSSGQCLRLPLFFEEALPRDCYQPSSQDLQLLRQWEISRTENYIYVHKPAGLPVQGGSGLSRNLATMLKGAEEDGSLRLIHRLDKDTSGIVAVARNLQAAREGALKFASNHSVQKLYIALVWGKLPNSGKIDQSINGKTALTYYKLEKYHAKSNMSLVTLQPKTGRKHQLRLHMLKFAQGIVGDKRYGTSKNRKTDRIDISRLMLHHSLLLLEAEKPVKAKPCDCFCTTLTQAGFTLPPPRFLMER